VPPEQSLPVRPQTPAVPVVDDGSNPAWRSAPCARLLPAHWIAIVHSGGRPVLAVSGRDIVQPLAVGPDPKAPAPDIADGDSAVDAGMKWMVDFDEAETKGMALRIAIPGATLAAGLDSLFVLGVASTNATDTAALLADLLDAHHYTDGADFIRLGTPTNNTADRRAGCSSVDPGRAGYASEVVADPAALDGASTRCGCTALGLPPSAWRRPSAVLPRQRSDTSSTCSA
jgi:hypothetical protein